MLFTFGIHLPAVAARFTNPAHRAKEDGHQFVAGRLDNAPEPFDGSRCSNRNMRGDGAIYGVSILTVYPCTSMYIHASMSKIGLGYQLLQGVHHH